MHSDVISCLPEKSVYLMMEKISYQGSYRVIISDICVFNIIDFKISFHGHFNACARLLEGSSIFCVPETAEFNIM